nr:uncharacterized protein LOC114819520 isoform X3 [Malus domestica]
MESDVLLIEIVGEDDSLLQLPPDDAVSSSSTNKISKDDAFFFCSPLQPLRSKPLGNFDKEKWCSTKFTPQQISTSTGSMVSGEAKG